MVRDATERIPKGRLEVTDCTSDSITDQRGGKGTANIRAGPR